MMVVNNVVIDRMINMERFGRFDLAEITSRPSDEKRDKSWIIAINPNALPYSNGLNNHGNTNIAPGPAAIPRKIFKCATTRLYMVLPQGPYLSAIAIFLGVSVYRGTNLLSNAALALVSANGGG